MRKWQLQEAKSRFSELVRLSQGEGPQEISVRGEPAVVVVSRRDYDRLRGRRASFVDFLRHSPLAGVELDLHRDKSLTRDLPP